MGLSIPYWPQFSFLGQPDILVGAFKALCSLILTPHPPSATTRYSLRVILVPYVGHPIYDMTSMVVQFNSV